MGAPPRAIDVYKEDVWDEIGYRPHKAQRRFHEAVARNRVNLAGRRTGKSVSNGNEVVPMALAAAINRTMLEDMGIRQEVWAVGPNYTDSEKEFRVAYNALKRLGVPFDRPGTYYSKQDMSISLWGGRFLLHAKSGAKPESLVGEGLHHVLMCEAAKLKSTVWHRFIRPMLIDFEGTSSWGTTPEGKNWFYDDIWMATKRDDPEWWGQRVPSWVNTYVFKKPTSAQGVRKLKELVDAGYTNKWDLHVRLGEAVDREVISMCVDLSPAAFGQEVECSFSDKVGRVFKYWEEDLHVRNLRRHETWPIYIATDYGYTHPNVALFIQVGPFNEIRVLAEYYRTHRTDEEFASDVLNDPRLRSLAQDAVGLYPDPEDPGASRVLSERWKVPIHGGTGGLLKDRLNAIMAALKPRNAHLPWDHPERTPTILVDTSCFEMRREMDAYSWPDRRSGNQTQTDQPLDKDNHCPEALGRFFAGHGLTATAPVISEAFQTARRGG